MDYSTYGYSDYGSSAGDAVAGAVYGVYLVVLLIVYVLQVVAMWKIFDKAGETPWYSLIPILNMWKLYEITYGAGWKCFLTLVPFVGQFVPLIQAFRLGQAFGKGTAFNIGLVFLTPIFMIILGFDNNTSYFGPVGSFL
ncbi:MAG: hypothetical protein IJ055_10730 [Oscillospiraceae bacterium]|nr:hypothetical protein [Oscillospiraceae bacterium]